VKNHPDSLAALESETAILQLVSPLGDARSLEHQKPECCFERFRY